MPRILLSLLILLVVANPSLSQPASAAGPQVKKVTIGLASCCVTERALVDEIIPGFIRYWKQVSGEDVEIVPSFAGSGTLRNQVAGGSPIQVGVFSSELYPITLQRDGFIATDWTMQQHRGVVARSVMVMVV